MCVLERVCQRERCWVHHSKKVCYFLRLGEGQTLSFLSMCVVMLSQMQAVCDLCDHGAKLCVTGGNISNACKMLCLWVA